MMHRTCQRPSAKSHRAQEGATIVLLTLALCVLPQTSRWRHDAMAGVSPGYVLMIHSIVEPHSYQALDDAETGNATLDQLKTGATYASGAASATRNDDSIVFNAILYRADTVYPVVVRDPRLEVKAVDSDRRLMLEPNLPAGGRICHVETSWANHEGPLEACTGYKVPVRAFNGINVVTLTLHFTDAMGPHQTVHSFPAHFLLHMAIEGAPVDLKAVDATITEPTPLVIQSLLETKSM
ncbi:MAG TPA: hypothetical protein VG034_16050 [Acidimicrobiia bacterium]|jgi:hypothetical protein|nr:hypothetical protein [Acidimicrobiia bacterium]